MIRQALSKRVAAAFSSSKAPSIHGENSPYSIINEVIPLRNFSPAPLLLRPSSSSATISATDHATTSAAQLAVAGTVTGEAREGASGGGAADPGSGGGASVSPSGKGSEGGGQSFAWRAAKLVAGLAAVAAVGSVGYVTYAFENAAIRRKLNDLESSISSGAAEEAPLGQLYVAGVKKAISLGRAYADARQDVEENLEKFMAPSSDKLLPDLLPHERQVFTLVVDLDDTLVHSEWKRDRGWRTFKRPGAEAFLERMAQFYEVVVFSDQINMSVDPIVDRLDQKGSVRFRLYRDATQYKDGEYLKDLSKLNRDPRKVIYLSAHPESVIQKDNFIPISQWKLDSGDTSLLDLLPFLECVSLQRPPDVRNVLASYEGQDIPTAFKERARQYQRQIQERRQNSLLRFTRPN